MSRPYCKRPERCAAGPRGPCPVCHDTTAISRRASERMRTLNADPAFAARNAERAAERMRKRHGERRGYEVPPELRQFHAKLRSHGYGQEEIVRLLSEAAARAVVP